MWVPTHDRTITALSKNYRFSVNMQVVIDANTRLVTAVGRPVPGNHNDCTAYRDSGAEEAVERARDGRRLRARVEHAFAHMKWWNTLRNRRRERDGVHRATHGIALMRNLAMTG